jgi:hypothetical protein
VRETKGKLRKSKTKSNLSGSGANGEESSRVEQAGKADETCMGGVRTGQERRSKKKRANRGRHEARRDHNSRAGAECAEEEVDLGGGVVDETCVGGVRTGQDRRSKKKRAHLGQHRSNGADDEEDSDSDYEEDGSSFQRHQRQPALQQQHGDISSGGSDMQQRSFSESAAAAATRRRHRPR